MHNHEKNCKGKMKKKGQLFTGIAVIILAIAIIGGAFVFSDKVKGTPDLPPVNVERKPVTSCPDEFVRDNNGNCIQLPKDIPCPVGQLKDNAGNCISIGCPVGMIKNVNGDCIVAERTSDPALSQCVPDVVIKNAWTRTKGRIGDSSQQALGSYPAVVSYDLIVRNECEASFYVEAGLLKSSLMIITHPSACDGNPHFTGQFVRGSKNTKFSTTRPAGELPVAFFPHDYGTEGKLTIVGGVYTGCFKDGGKSIDEILTNSYTIDNDFSDTQITQSVMKVIDNFN